MIHRNRNEKIGAWRFHFVSVTPMDDEDAIEDMSNPS